MRFLKRFKLITSPMFAPIIQEIAERDDHDENMSGCISCRLPLSRQSFCRPPTLSILQLCFAKEKRSFVREHSSILRVQQYPLGVNSENCISPRSTTGLPSR